jgi:hypothetical protein
LKTYGLTIYLIHNANVDLKEILEVIGEDGRQSTWKISDADCLGESAETLHKFSDEGKEISGIQFYKLALGIYQTLSGEFNSYKPNTKLHWLLIRSIRGDEFDIETDDFTLLNKFRNKFKDVKDLIY